MRAVLLVIGLCGCATPFSSDPLPVIDPPSPSYIAESVKSLPVLDLVALSGLPGERLFVAGTVGTDSMHHHGLLLASSDAGATWREVIREETECTEIEILATWGGENIWAFSMQSIEGVSWLETLYRSADAGDTWERIEISEALTTTTGAIEHVEFFGPNDGIAILHDGMRNLRKLATTRDGGRTWSNTFTADGYQFDKIEWIGAWRPADTLKLYGSDQLFRLKDGVLESREYSSEAAWVRRASFRE